MGIGTKSRCTLGLCIPPNKSGLILELGNFRQGLSLIERLTLLKIGGILSIFIFPHLFLTSQPTQVKTFNEKTLGARIEPQSSTHSSRLLGHVAIRFPLSFSQQTLYITSFFFKKNRISRDPTMAPLLGVLSWVEQGFRVPS